MSTTWNDIKPWVAKLAPMLGTALGGPFGGMAGAAIGAALGLGKDASAQSIKDAITTGTLDADHILALKNAENEFTLKMTQAGYENQEKLADMAYKEAALEVQDTTSARDREKLVLDKTPAIGFYFTTFGFFGLLVLMMFYEPPAGSKSALDIMLGALGLAWGNEVKYYYGGGSGDSRLHDMLFHSAPPAPPVPPPA